MTLLSRVCTTAFLHDQKHLLKNHRAALAARRTGQSFATWRQRHRRARGSTLFQTIRRRRSRPFAADCRSLRRLTPEEIERYSRGAETEMEPLSAPDGGRGASNETMANGNARGAHRHHSSIASFPSYSSRPSSMTEMAPPPPEDPPARSSRSTSSASRNTNRLSITLPIAPPTADPSRPVPASASTHPSVPGTPVRQPTQPLASLPDANELIIAIAAQERRVMELREELGRAEDDLKKIKRQWTLHEAYSKADRRQDASRPAPQPEAWPGTPADDDLAARRGAEADRRRLLLQTQGTPRDERKRVFSGRHARTLSLLSPTKPPAEPFAVHEDAAPPRPVPAPEHRPAAAAAVRRQAALNKRATWQPHQFAHAHSTSINAQLQGGPMSQIVEDFKMGFRTFYEDIRQITVGDEPVNGAAVNGTAQGTGPTPAPGTQRYAADDQATIRATPSAPRPTLAAAFEYPDPETPSKGPRAPAGDSSAAAAPQRERNARARNKHFSWTPLSFEGIDGDAWLTFDSPASGGKSTRWSGSTMNEEEKSQEVESPLTKKAQSPAALSPQRLEELTATVVNRLSPSNLKRTAEEYVTQWEQSMVDPVEGPQACSEGKEGKEGREGEGKENAAPLA